MATASQIRSTSITPRAAFFSIALMVVLMGGMVITVIKLMGGGTGSPSTPKGSNASSSQGTNSQNGPGIDDMAIHDYRVIPARNLFQSVAAGSEANFTDGYPPDTTDLNHDPGNGDPPGDDDNSSNNSSASTAPQIAYTGKMELPSGTYALLENLDSHEDIYAGVGSEAFGYTVVDISDEKIMLELNGRKTELVFGENKADDNSTAPTEPADGTSEAAVDEGGDESSSDEGGYAPDGEGDEEY